MAEVRKKTLQTKALRVRVMMLKKGVRPRHLAKHFRVTRSAIGMALHGYRREMLDKISEYLGTLPDKIQ